MYNTHFQFFIISLYTCRFSIMTWNRRKIYLEDTVFKETSHIMIRKSYTQFYLQKQLVPSIKSQIKSLFWGKFTKLEQKCKHFSNSQHLHVHFTYILHTYHLPDFIISEDKIHSNNHKWSSQKHQPVKIVNKPTQLMYTNDTNID